jgi:hypothetical protein
MSVTECEPSVSAATGYEHFNGSGKLQTYYGSRLAQSRHDLSWEYAFAVAIGGKADMACCSAYVCL